MGYRKVPAKYKDQAQTDAKDIQTVSDRLVQLIKEYLDGFIVMGFTQDKGLPVLLQQSEDVKTHMALNDMFIRNFIKMKDEEYGEEPFTLFTE